MNVATRLPTTADEFLRWATRQEGRYEFAGGRTVMMVRVTRDHAEISTAWTVALASRLDRARWLVAAEYAVRLGDTVRFPDILVAPRGSSNKELGTSDPLLIIEVQSPSSAVLDSTTKLREYTSLPSLKLYVIASQDEPIVWVWRRGEDGAFPLDPEMIDGRDAVLPVPELGVELPLGEAYRGIGEV